LKHETAHDYSTAGIVHGCGVNLPDATENRNCSLCGKQACSLFSKNRSPKAFGAGGRGLKLVSFVDVIDLLLKQRHDIQDYRTSGSCSDLLSSIERAFRGGRVDKIQAECYPSRNFTLVP
jgi:hypothetical protein